jgi:LEA14-like dessication related protein
MTIARAIPVVSMLLLAGCPKNIKLPDLSAMTPKVRFDDVKLGKPDWKGVDAEFVVAVDNPNPVGVKLASWTWDLDIAGSDLLAGDQQDGAQLEAAGESKLAIPARLQFADLLEVGKAAKGQAEVPFTVSGTMGFNTPLGVVTVPWEDNGTLPVLRKPKIRVQGLKLAKLDVLAGQVDLLLDLGVSHEGGGTLSLADVDWTLDLGGKRVADGTAAKLAEVAAGQESTISLPIGVKVVTLGTSLVKALKNKQDIQVDFGADANVGTPLGVLPLKISEGSSVKVQ